MSSTKVEQRLNKGLSSVIFYLYAAPCYHLQVELLYGPHSTISTNVAKWPVSKIELEECELIASPASHHSSTKHLFTQQSALLVHWTGGRGVSGKPMADSLLGCPPVSTSPPRLTWQSDVQPEREGDFTVQSDCRQDKNDLSNLLFPGCMCSVVFMCWCCVSWKLSVII